MTQGDLLAMSMYSLTTLPLINHLVHSAISQWQLYNYTWYADDASAAGCLQALHEWMDTLVSIGLSYGYFPNATKTWLLII